MLIFFAFASAMPTLFVSTGATFTASTLYQVNADGTTTLIGPIVDSVSSTQLTGVSALAYHQSSHTLYGIQNNNGAGNYPNLYTIDYNTGVATLVNAFPDLYGGQNYRVPDISFNSAGQLFGICGPSSLGPPGPSLVSISLVPGSPTPATLVGPGYTNAPTAGVFNGSPGLSFYPNAGEELYFKNGGTAAQMCQLNVANGQNTARGCGAGTLSAANEGYSNALTYDTTNSIMYTLCQNRNRVCSVNMANVNADATTVGTTALANDLGVSDAAGLAYGFLPIIGE